MKKSLALLAAPLLLGACSNQPGINGRLSDVETDTLLVAYVAAGTNDVKRDTIAMQQGKFHFNLPDATTPVEVFLQKKPSLKPNPDGSIPAASMKVIPLLLLPGETLNLTGSFDEYRMSGNDFYKACTEVGRQEAEITKQLNKLDEEMRQIMETHTQGTITEDSAMNAMAPYEGKIRDVYSKLVQVKIDYIKQHPAEDVSAYFAAQLPTDYSKDLVGLIDEKVKNGPLGIYCQLIEKEIEKEKLMAEATEKVQPGKEAPAFTLKDINGKEFSLSSLKGKYVVLDFWGSWCGWCIKGFPEMKKAYEKHKAKVEFVGIDCNDTEEKWKKAVADNQLPWMHVRNEGEPDVATMYAIQGYPTKIIVDPEGKINKVVVGEDPEFYTYLDDLLK